jgi:CBS domain-containing protein
MRISDIVGAKASQDVITISPDATVRDLIRTLAEHNVGALIVSGDGSAVEGIVSERDVVRHLGTDWAALANRPVSDVMTKNVVSVSRFATVADVMERMTEKRIRHMPIVENGELVGIVSIGDVVKRKIEETEQEATALKEYIAS